MKLLLLMFMGHVNYCRVFHVPSWSSEMQWYGLWCRPCGVRHGGDRRSA